MFGNKELEIAERKLSKAINMMAMQITRMDPAMRNLWLYSHKELVTARYAYGSTMFAGDFSDDEKETGDILAEVVKKIEELIQQERYEGEFYNEGLCIKSSEGDDPNSFYNRRRRQVLRDFPIPEEYIEEK